MYTIIFSIITLLILGISFILIKKEPRRLLNGFLLQIGIIMIYLTMLIHATENGHHFVLETYIIIALYMIMFYLGVMLIIDFFLVIKKEGISIANLMPIGFGILSIVVSFVGYNDVYNGLSGSMLQVKVLSVLQNIVLYIPFAVGSVLIYSVVYLLLPKKKNVDYIVVLGCGLKKNGEVTPLLRGRLDCAIKAYHRSNKQAKFVTSGGQGRDELISESQAMKNYLLANGIEENKIIMEDKSVNTRENLIFSKVKIEEDGCGENVLISTSNYHVLRAVIIAHELDFNAQGIGGHTAFYYLPVAFIREYIAMIFQNKKIIIIYMMLAIIMGVII